MNPTFNPFQYNAPGVPNISPQEAQRRADIIAKQNAMKKQSQVIQDLNIPATFGPPPDMTGGAGDNTGGGGDNTGGGGGGGTYDAAAAQAAAQAAKDEATRRTLREGIGGLLTKAMDVYKSLYGGLESLAGSQKAQLEKQYGQNVAQIGQQFTQELPKIGQAYAARGAYDSTFRTGAEQVAQQAYAQQLSDLATEQTGALGKIGAAYTAERAKYGVGETALQNISNRLGEVTDINELTALRNSIESKIGELQTAQAGLGTEAMNVAATAGLQGMSDKFAQASQTIQNIVQGQAPALLKKQIAQQIIVNSNLTEEEQKQLQNVVNQIA